jgi:hypothetical protein
VNILFGKCFGIGNAVCSVPAIKALHSMGHTIDVLIGTLPDDVGTLDVFTLLRDHVQVIRKIWVNAAPSETPYDLAIMSIPSDGRWKNGVHFSAREVWDGRGRPEHSQVFGFSSWKKHEVEYQMENAYRLGFTGNTPSCEFMHGHLVSGDHLFYLGIGYKKDAAGYWKQKHWGNENYAALVKMILADHPLNRVVTTGDMADLQLSARPIMDLVKDDRFRYEPGGLRKSFDVVNDCHMYVGNDTGMMHVAAARGRKVVSIFMIEGASTKSFPWCPDHTCLEAWDGNGNGPRTISPEEVFRATKDLR